MTKTVKLHKTLYVGIHIKAGALSYIRLRSYQFIMAIERGMTDIQNWDSAMAAASAIVWALDARIKMFHAKVKQVSRDDYFKRCWDVVVGSVDGRTVQRRVENQFGYE